LQALTSVHEPKTAIEFIPEEYRLEAIALRGASASGCGLAEGLELGDYEDVLRFEQGRSRLTASSDCNEPSDVSSEYQTSPCCSNSDNSMETEEMLPSHQTSHGALAIPALRAYESKVANEAADAARMVGLHGSNPLQGGICMRRAISASCMHFLKSLTGRSSWAGGAEDGAGSDGGTPSGSKAAASRKTSNQSNAGKTLHELALSARAKVDLLPFSLIPTMLHELRASTCMQATAQKAKSSAVRMKELCMSWTLMLVSECPPRDKAITPTEALKASKSSANLWK